MNKLTGKIFVIFVLLSVFIGCSLKQRRYFVGSISFDENKWKINDAEMHWNVRPGMARDLIKRKVLIGKSCSKMNRLLSLSYRTINCDENSAEFELKVFFKTFGFGSDSIATEDLKLYFDENKKVKKAEIVFYDPNVRYYERQTDNKTKTSGKKY